MRNVVYVSKYTNVILKVMEDIQTLTRVTLKNTRPNPLFQTWLEELYSEAKESDSKLQDMLKNALESLRRYPLPLQSGADCAILKGFGKKLCLFLDKKLDVYNSQLKDTDKISVPDKNDYREPFSSFSENAGKIKLKDSDIPNLPAANAKLDRSNKKPAKVSKIYKPAFRSGGYAILIALLNQINDNPNSPALNKQDLIERAQAFSEESFVRPKPESHYTAWSNMSRLIAKGLVNKSKSRNAEFSLTKEGCILAKVLLEDSKNMPSNNDIIFNDNLNTNYLNKSEPVIIDTAININVNEETPQVFNKTANDFISMPASSFEVILLIDKQETGGVSKKNDPTVAQFKKYPHLKHEYRHLKVGDFTWIARSLSNKSDELVLPYIVERKRMDDLGASIKDGRFHEQKFRLRKCGLKNVIYLIENYGSNKHVGLPYQSLMQALANTRVQDEFKVHITDSLSNSVRFLAMMTKRLSILYEDKDLKGVNGEARGEDLMTFLHFNKSSSKNRPLTVTETFIKMLLQLKGMSVEKALAITDSYKTPKDLIEAYSICSKKEGEMLLSNLKYGDLNRNVGPAVSKTIFQLFTEHDFL